MSPKRVDYESIPKEDAPKYLRKAEEFIGTMNDCLVKGHWNSAGVMAVHGVISAHDALTVGLLGRKCTGQKHDDAVSLSKSLPAIRSLDENVTRFLRIIVKKSVVEYGGRGLKPDEAAAMAKDAEKFVDWVRTVLRTPA